MRIILLLLLLLAPPSSAQTPRKRKSTPAATPPPAQQTEQQASAWPIASLKVEGNKIYPADRVLLVAGLKIGQVAGKAEFDAARDKLVASGAFETVGYQFNPSPQGGYNAVFQVTEVEQVFPYHFLDIPAEETALRKYLHQQEPLFDDKIPGTQPVLDRFATHVADYLARGSGKGQAIVAKMAAERVGELAVFIEPSDLPSVAEVKFTGNKAITTPILQRAISGVGIGAIYTQEHFQQLLDNAIRPIYDAEGRVRVKFPKLETEPAKDVKGLAVKVTVDEGPVYKLRRVDVAGAPDPEALAAEGKFKLKETVNFDEVQISVNRIRDSVRRTGYLDVKVDTERKIDDKNLMVNLVVHLNMGPKYTFGKVEMQGLDLLSEPQIRKMWGIRSGDAFNPEYPDYFLSRIRADGMFDNLGKTKSTTNIDAKTHVVDVTLFFKGDGKGPPMIGPGSEKRRSQDAPF